MNLLPCDKPFEGKLTLQLFNAKNGRLEEQVETNNFAANQAIENAKWQQRNVFKAGLSALGVADTDYQPYHPSNCMVLSDSTLAVSPATEWFMQGKTLGWASKATYAGTDIWRGTVNTTPLQATPTSVKWVFDWPTHAGNGLIGSVGWVNSRSQTLSATNPEFRCSLLRESAHVTAGVWYRFARATSTLFFGNTGNTTVYVLDSIFSQTTTFNVGAQFTAVRGLAWDGTNSFLWIIGDNGADKVIAAYNSSGVLQTGPFTVTNRVYILLAYDGTNLWSLTNVSGNQYTAWSLNPTNGADVTNFNLTVNVNNLICGLAWDVGRSLLWTRQYSGDGYTVTGLQGWNTSGEKKTVEFALGAHPSYTSNQGVYTENNGSYNNNLTIFNDGTTRCDIDFVDDNRIAVPSGTTVHVCKANSMGTRALLGTPVNKANTQTLKLIYEINYV